MRAQRQRRCHLSYRKFGPWFYPGTNACKPISWKVFFESICLIIESQIIITGFDLSWLRLWVLSIKPKFPKISGWSQMERFVSVLSDRNIWDHLWRWIKMVDKRLLMMIEDEPTKCQQWLRKRSFTQKDLGIRYSLCYNGVFRLTEEREEHLLVGFPKKNNHSLMPLEWCIITKLSCKVTVQAAGILQIGLPRKQ